MNAFGSYLPNAQQLEERFAHRTQRVHADERFGVLEVTLDPVLQLAFGEARRVRPDADLAPQAQGLDGQEAARHRRLEPRAAVGGSEPPGLDEELVHLFEQCHLSFVRSDAQPLAQRLDEDLHFLAIGGIGFERQITELQQPRRTIACGERPLQSRANRCLPDGRIIERHRGEDFECSLIGSIDSQGPHARRDGSDSTVEIACWCGAAERHAVCTAERDNAQPAGLILGAPTGDEHAAAAERDRCRRAIGHDVVPRSPSQESVEARMPADVVHRDAARLLQHAQLRIARLDLHHEERENRRPDHVAELERRLLGMDRRSRALDFEAVELSLLGAGHEQPAIVFLPRRERSNRGAEKLSVTRTRMLELERFALESPDPQVAILGADSKHGRVRIEAGNGPHASFAAGESSLRVAGRSPRRRDQVDRAARDVE